jgi:hypothetical protein
LFLDGVFIDDEKKSKRFVPVIQHQPSEIVALAHMIGAKLAKYLERSGLIEGDMEGQTLSEDALNAGEMHDHQGYSVQYRISVGPQKGRKVFRLQTLPATENETASSALLGNVAGFSLHAGVSAKADERDKLERRGCTLLDLLFLPNDYH